MTDPVSTACHARLAHNNLVFLSYILFLFTFKRNCLDARVDKEQASEVMKVMSNMLQWAVWSIITLAVIVKGIEVREPDNEHEVSPPASSLLVSVAPEPSDNGMVVGNPPVELEATGSTSFIPEVNVVTVSSTTVDNVLPDNHKNFTGSPFLGTIESPPYLDSYNKYKQQYKEYYAQKSQYASLAKPFKFQETPTSPSGLSAFGEESLSESRKPFPYLYKGVNLVQPTAEQVTYQIPEQNVPGIEPDNDIPASTGSSLLTSLAGYGNSLSTFFGGNQKLSPHSNQAYHSHGQRSQVGLKNKSGGSWKKILSALTTVVPLGLFLATLTPNLLYINSTEENRPSRVRSLEDPKDAVVDPLIELVERFGGLEAMKDPKCEDRFFCEMSVLGRNYDSNLVEKGFWFLANETPDDIAESVGMKQLFQAIRNNTCDIYHCEPKKLQQDRIETQTKDEILEKEKKKPKKFKKFVKS